jgi:[ribosomal protein S18]-alanine N-acetyltransferase
MSSLALPAGFPFDDPALPYQVDLMRTSDLHQVMDIERVAFASPWPMSAYRYELTQNDLSTYLVLKLRRSGGMTPLGHKGGMTPPLRLGGMTPLLRKSVEPVLAYGGFWMIVDEAHISTIAVHPKWRRRGLGEMVLVAMVDAAIMRGAAEVTLEVRVSNLAAQGLYHKYAFVQVGRRKAYYTNNREDALIMTTPRVDEAGFVERYGRLKAELRQRLLGHLEHKTAG